MAKIKNGLNGFNDWLNDCKNAHGTMLVYSRTVRPSKDEDETLQVWCTNEVPKHEVPDGVIKEIDSRLVDDIEDELRAKGGGHFTFNELKLITENYASCGINDSECKEKHESCVPLEFTKKSKNVTCRTQ